MEFETIARKAAAVLKLNYPWLPGYVESHNSGTFEDLIIEKVTDSLYSHGFLPEYGKILFGGLLTPGSVANTLPRPVDCDKGGLLVYVAAEVGNYNLHPLKEHPYDPPQIANPGEILLLLYEAGAENCGPTIWDCYRIRLVSPTPEYQFITSDNGDSGISLVNTAAGSYIKSLVGTEVFTLRIHIVLESALPDNTTTDIATLSSSAVGVFGENFSGSLLGYRGKPVRLIFNTVSASKIQVRNLTGAQIAAGSVIEGDAIFPRVFPFDWIAAGNFTPSTPDSPGLMSIRPGGSLSLKSPAVVKSPAVKTESVADKYYGTPLDIDTETEE